MKLSVVVPVYADPEGWLPRIRERLSGVAGLELLEMPDGDSRAARLQAGIEAAKAELVLLHHPRSLVAADGLRWLVEHSGEVSWGGFTHSFDWSHPVLRFTSWYSNRVRARLKGIVYLDHCVFFQKSLLTRPIPPVEIFEDTELSKILRESGPPKVLPFFSTTSALRFRANGVLRQALLNQRLKFGYYLGMDDRAMNRRYERGLGLNGS